MKRKTFAQILSLVMVLAMVLTCAVIFSSCSAKSFNKEKSVSWQLTQEGLIKTSYNKRGKPLEVKIYSDDSLPERGTLMPDEVLQYTYGKGGALESVVLLEGITHTVEQLYDFKQDKAGNVTELIPVDAMGLEQAREDHISFTYSKKGKLESGTVYTLSTGSDRQKIVSLVSEYDKDGRLVSLTVPGNEKVTFSYTEKGLPTEAKVFAFDWKTADYASDAKKVLSCTFDAEKPLKANLATFTQVEISGSSEAREEYTTVTTISSSQIATEATHTKNGEGIGDPTKKTIDISISDNVYTLTYKEADEDVKIIITLNKTGYIEKMEYTSTRKTGATGTSVTSSTLIDLTHSEAGRLLSLSMTSKNNGTLSYKSTQTLNERGQGLVSEHISYDESGAFLRASKEEIVYDDAYRTISEKSFEKKTESGEYKLTEESTYTYLAGGTNPSVEVTTRNTDDTVTKSKKVCTEASFGSLTEIEYDETKNDGSYKRWTKYGKDFQYDSYQEKEVYANGSYRVRVLKDQENQTFETKYYDKDGKLLETYPY